MQDDLCDRTDSPGQTARELPVSRREAIRTGADAGSRLATAIGFGAVPLALASLAGRADAQTQKDLADSLQFMLLIENMLVDLNTRAVSSSGFVPSTILPIFQTILAHDKDHVTLLSNLLTAIGGIPENAVSFDWTAKGTFAGFNFSSGQTPTFLVIAQGLGDLAVRAYKGQLARMTGNAGTMTQVMTIQSVDARHAAAVRIVRTRKPWITGASRDDLPGFFQPVYDGEDATMHAAYDASALAGADGGTAAVTEAFDEPLTRAQAQAIIQPFLP
jgi:hypothetical protein